MSRSSQRRCRKRDRAALNSYEVLQEGSGEVIVHALRPGLIKRVASAVAEEALAVRVMRECFENDVIP
jgi:hypothetical protein